MVNFVRPFTTEKIKIERRANKQAMTDEIIEQEEVIENCLKRRRLCVARVALAWLRART